MGYTPHVLVAGGTPTGVGLARDLAMRGLDVTLVTRGSPGGTVGEPLLDRGARAAASDPEKAARLHAESQTVREIAGHCIEDTGGLILAPNDETSLEDTREGCGSADIPVEWLDEEAVSDLEPGVAETGGALAVPGARIDPFGLLVATVEDAQSYGATVETRTELTGFFVDDGAVTHAKLRTRGDDEAEMRRFDYVVNATGTRAGQVAGLADIEIPVDIETRPALVANERPTDRLLIGSGSGPRIVPYRGRCVVTGSPRTITESSEPTEADSTVTASVDTEAVDGVIDGVAELVPALRTARVLRCWSAKRAVPRDMSETRCGFRVFDHETRDGVWGLSTVVGATLTTHRLAAERVADQVCGKFGITRDCLTDTHSLPEVARDTTTLVEEYSVDPNPVLCPCTSVTRAEVRGAIDRDGDRETDVETVRARTGVGMGACQGRQCAHCLAAELHPARDPEAVDEALTPFLDGRWGGQRHALWGDQLTAAARTYRLHAGTLRLHPEQDPESVDVDAFEGGNRDTTDDDPASQRGSIP